MGILEELKDQGWYLTEEGLKKLPDCTDSKKIIAAALDFDFRDIASGALPQELTRKGESLPGRIVLQVQKIRNISAPKANEESRAAPRFLQLELSDGVTVMQALELENISALSLNTPPGTKIYFKCQQIPLMQGMIILRVTDVQVLGGKVAALVEKWEMTRSLQKYAKSGRLQTGSSGPPPWIPFGQKLHANVGADKNFKSLAQAEKEKEGKENDEFNAMRSEAIAEAAKAGSKKIFGGGNHQILDHNVKKILEKGYSEEEAKHALRTTGNSLERALYNLKRRGEDYRNREEKSKTLPMAGKRGPKEFGKRGKEADTDAAKPAGNVSLFDFLTDKLPANADQTSTMTQSVTTNLSSSSTTNPFRQENNFTRPMTKAGSEPSSKPFNNPSSTNNSSQPYQDRRQNHDNAKSYDRAKFENNLSSSFATRNTSHPHDERSGRYSNSNRGRGGGNPFHGKPNHHFEENSERHQRDQRNSVAYSSGRGGRSSHERSTGNYKFPGNSRRGGASQGGGYENRRQNDYQNPKEPQSQHRQEQPQRQEQVQRNGYDQKAPNGKKGAPRYQQEKEQPNSTQNNSGNARNYDNNRQPTYHQPPTNNQNQNDNNNSRNNNDHAVNMNKLVESTSKLKIDKTRSGPSPNSQQQAVKNQQQPPPVNASTTQRLQQTFGPLPNGFNYDPSKIIGFQSKETNEFALTLLKSQGIPVGPGSHGQALAQGLPPSAQQPQYISGPPPPIQMTAQPFAPTAFMVPPSGLPSTHSPSAFGMIPGDSWNWKIGDRCLAKYWDDGRYYEAEITGISDKTCVVLFIGYGNHEEVLKPDCLPITDSQNRTINFSTSMQHGPPVSIPPPSSMPSRGVPNRYRCERQVYIPPPKRDN